MGPAVGGGAADMRAKEASRITPVVIIAEVMLPGEGL